MALDQILSSFMPPDIFIRNVKKKDTHYVDHKRGIRIVSGAVIGRTFLFKLSFTSLPGGIHSLRDNGVLSTLRTMQISLKMSISDDN